MSVFHWPEAKLRACYTVAYITVRPNVMPTAVSDVLTDVYSLSSFCRHLNLHNTRCHLQTTLGRSASNRRHIFSKSVTHNTQDRIKQATCFGRLSFSSFPAACIILSYMLCVWVGGGYAVAQLVEVTRYKSEGRGFDSRRYHRNFSLT
jgi:hypothetical protein